MDQETIRTIAAEIAGHLPSYAWSYAWPLLLIQTVLFLIAAAVGLFMSEYLKTRGKNLATKADFDRLQRQLQANTELVETIKAEVGQKDWARREWTNLRRLKLEALLTAMHDCGAYLDRLQASASEGKVLSERGSEPELRTVAALYLPELESQVSDYLEMYHTISMRTLELATDILAAGADRNARVKAYTDFREWWKPQYKRFIGAGAALTTAARELLVEIMGVAPCARDADGPSLPDPRSNDSST